jgi:predicted O-methyltransferase YrrM
MEEATKIEIVDGVTFELRPNARKPTNPEWVCLRTTRKVTDRYLALAPNFQGCRMVEVGVDQGGSTSFFLKRYRPQGLLAIELSSKPVPELMSFLAKHDPQQHVSVHWGVDQADDTEVPRLVSGIFGDQALDLVIDDASHSLIPTTKTFELLFPHLREDGLYIIEDWSTDHKFERQLDLEERNNPDGKLARAISAARAGPNFKPDYSIPMSLLACQLLIASGRNPDWVKEVRCFQGYCEIKRGNAHIESGTPISSYIGEFGCWMFDKGPS